MEDKGFFKKRKKINKGDFSYINWWELKDEKDLWLENFIKYHFKNKIKKHINFYSVFGPYKSLRKKGSFNTIKIFFSGENVLNYRKYKSLNENEKEAKKFIRRRFIDYSKYAIDDMDISLGFSDFDNEKYIRFPLWIMYMFKPICDYKEIHDSANGKSYNLVLSHYPIFSWKRMGKGFFLLYGHTHDSNEDAYYQSCLMKMVESDCQHVYKTEVRAINVGCMKPWMNYEPRTLTELLSYSQ